MSSDGSLYGSSYGAAMSHNRFRPPEVLLSAEVYARLRAASGKERRARRGAARPFGVRAMDAIEAHADRLQRVWIDGNKQQHVGLFARPAPGMVPPRRRHATPPVCIALSGIDATNAALLDRYVGEWSAGTRAALVEQALRYEFGMD